MSSVLLFAHATGLCKETWRPVLAALESKASHVLFDFQGHGSRGADAIQPGASWDDFAVRDVLAAAARAPAGVPLVGVGHSFGGAALLKAELAQPGTFAALVLSEPILFAADVGAGDRSALVDRARKRRAQWSSRAEARAFFASRPLFQAWHPAALAGYLEGGLVGGSREESACGEAGAVRLACAPDSEAACYGGAGRSVFAALPRVSCPVTVLVGATSQHLDHAPSTADHGAAGGPPTTLAHFQGLAQRLARGAVEVVAGAGHFHPQEQPGAVARAVDAAVAAAIAAEPPRPKL